LNIVASGLESTVSTLGALTNAAPLKPEAQPPLLLSIQRRAP